MYFCKRIPIPAYTQAKENSKRELDKPRSTSRVILYVPEPEPLVEEEQASPVGYRVKQIPGTLFMCACGVQGRSLLVSHLSLNVHFSFLFVVDFKLDPNGSTKPHLPATFLACEVIFGVIIAIGIGSLIVYSAFTDKDDNITSGTTYTLTGEQ